MSSRDDSASAGGDAGAAPSLAGRLEDVGFPEILQFLSLSGKTGRLVLTRRDGHGVVFVRRGRIIYAATYAPSNTVRESVGSILVCRGLVSEPTLSQALARQSQSGAEKRLGAILVEMGKVTPADLESVLRHQIGGVISELMLWKTGFFKFQAMDIPEGGEIEVDARDFVAAEGMDANQLLLEATRRLGEEAHQLPAGDPAAAAKPLGALIWDHHFPTLRGERTLTLLRVASGVVDRGLLLVVRGEEAHGVGHFGLDVAAPGHVPAPLRVPLRVPLHEASVLAEVVQRKETFFGSLASTPVNDALASYLGGPPAGPVVVIPSVLGESVALLFYGDRLREDEPIGDTSVLETLMTDAGLAMEKDALEARIRHFEQSRRA